MVGAYFPCFNQLTAANEILFSFRRFYPQDTVVMVNDAGDKDHAVLGEKYGCKYYYESENIGYPGGKDTVHQIIRWVKRFLKYISLIEEEWFILLEDDVLIMKAVDESTLKYDINGINPSNILPEPCQKLVGTNHKLVYGAMGGAIFRTSFFKQMAERMDVEQDLLILGEQCPPSLTGQNWYYSDVVLSYLTYLYGGTLGQYPEFAELWFRDLGQRLSQNRVATLNQYKYLYNYPPHPHLTELHSEAITLVMPTRGSGQAFDLWKKYGLPRLVQHLHVPISEFIIICPSEHESQVQSTIESYQDKLTFRIVTDEQLLDADCLRANGWTKQQLCKLKICESIRTEHYLILDDDLILTRDLTQDDIVDSDGKIYYGFESWPQSIVPQAGETHYAINPRWWIGSCVCHKVNYQSLMAMPNLMSATPQVLVTRIVHQMIHSLGKNWEQHMIHHQATEFCLYWIFILKTLRTDYYSPKNTLFAMDNATNILLQGLTREQVTAKISAGLNQTTYPFIVIQSWLSYPMDWIEDGFN